MPRCLLLDRNRIFGHELAEEVKAIGIKWVLSVSNGSSESYAPALDKDASDTRSLQLPCGGRIVSVLEVGGLHTGTSAEPSEEAD